MAIIKKAEPITEEDGLTVFNLSATEDADDWMRAGRLLEAAGKGDEEAKAEHDRMQRTPMAIVDDQEEG
jgi:hypothetical protein